MFKLSFVCISETILGYNLTDMPTMLNEFGRAVSNVSTLRNEVIHYHEAPPSIIHTSMHVFPQFVQVRLVIAIQSEVTYPNFSYLNTSVI